MKKRRLLAALLCLTLLFVIVACSKDNDGQGGNSTTQGGASSGDSSPGSSSGSSPGTSTEGSAPGGGAASGRDTLNIAVAADQGTLDVVFLAGDYTSIMHLVHEPLWDLDENGNVIWQLATSVDEVSDTQWLVHLREGVTFSNGNPLTASDVVFTINYYVNSGSMWGFPRTQTLDIPACTIADEMTVDLRFPAYHVANWSVLSDLVIYDEESFTTQEEASINPIGTGPYVFTEYVLNSHSVLTARDDYWGGTPNFKSIKIRVLAEPSQRVNALETGLVDIAMVSVEDVDYVSALPNINVISRYPPSWPIIAYNHNPVSLLSNVEARYAICHAINRQAIVDLVYLGRAEVMTYPMSKVVFDHETRFENMHPTYAIGYNTDLAKQYAEKTGLVGQTLTIITNGTPAYITMAEILQNMLQDIGINTVIHNYDPAGFTAATREPESWDIYFNGNICPNRRIADPLLNGVRYVPARQEGWDGVARFMEIGPTVFTTKDPQGRSKITEEMLTLYQDACLDYAICDVQTHFAFAADLTNIIFRTTSGMRYKDIKAVP